MKAIPGINNQTAAGYLLDLTNPEATLEMVEEAIAWINRSPENREAFERVQRFMNACDTLPEKPKDDATLLSRVAMVPGRHAFFAAATVVALFALIILTVSYSFLSLPSQTVGAEFQDQYASQVGEIRTVVLPDGTGVVLGGASRISAHYQSNKRMIDLIEGQALFTVAKDHRRPFTVKSGNGLVTAWGTQFDVKQEAGNITVTLVHGSVDVAAENRVHDEPVHLRPGSQVRLTSDGQISRPEHVDVAHVISWRSGILRFSDAELGSVVEDLNRYSRRTLILEGKDTGHIRVSGSVRIDAISDWLWGLSSAFDMEIDQGDPAVICIRSRRGPTTPIRKDLAICSQIASGGRSYISRPGGGLIR